MKNKVKMILTGEYSHIILCASCDKIYDMKVVFLGESDFEVRCKHCNEFMYKMISGIRFDGEE